MWTDLPNTDDGSKHPTTMAICIRLLQLHTAIINDRHVGTSSEWNAV